MLQSYFFLSSFSFFFDHTCVYVCTYVYILYQILTQLHLYSHLLNSILLPFRLYQCTLFALQYAGTYMIFLNFSLCCRNPTFKHCVTMHCVIKILVNFGATETQLLLTIQFPQDIIWYWQSEILAWIQRTIQPIYPTYVWQQTLQ